MSAKFKLSQNGKSETSEGKKTRERKSRNYPPQEVVNPNTGKRYGRYQKPVEIMPEVHDVPPEDKFDDPLDYYKSMKPYCERFAKICDDRISELSQMDKAARKDLRIQRQQKATTAKLLKSDAAKEIASEQPQVVVDLFESAVKSGAVSADQIAELLANLNKAKGVENGA
jgi:hypothetical protein